MKCYVRNTPEYQTLLGEYKSNTAVDSLINKWQNIYKTDDFPTISDVEVMKKKMKAAFSLKKRDFAESVLANLSRKKWISKWKNNYYVNNSNGITKEYDAVALAKNLEHVKRYLSFKNIPLDSVDIQKTKKSYRISIDSKIFTKQDVIEESRQNDGKHTADIVEHLGKMFPQLDVQILSVGAAKEYYDNLPKWQKAKVPFEKIKSFYVNGKAVLVEGRTDVETSIEEILHPFIDSIKVDNNKLFNALLAEAKKNFPGLSQRIEDSYTEDRGFTTEERELELVTQALSRHFNKEYTEQPTQSWLTKIKEFLQWVMHVINDLHKHLTGKGLKAGDINSKTSLTDLAKLLNTSDLEFTIERVVNKKIRYALQPEKETMLDNIMSHATDPQKATVKRMFHLSRSWKETIKSGTIAAGPSDLIESSSLVVKNEDLIETSPGVFEPQHKYFNLETGKEFMSLTTAIKGEFIDKESKQLNLDIGNDFDAIADGLAAGLAYEDVLPKLKVIHQSMSKQGDIMVPNALLAYNQLLGALETIKHNGSIIIPQVVFSDPQAEFEFNGKKYAGLAGTADLVVISPDGKIGIIDLKTGKAPIRSDSHDIQWNLTSGLLKEKGVETLSTRQQHGIQVNSYRRMAENMGYEVLDEQSFGISTLHINVDIEGKGNKQTFNDNFKFDGWLPHAPSLNEFYVDMILPSMVNEMSQADIESALKAAGVDNPTRDEDFLTPDEALPEDNDTSGTMYDALYKGLIDFNAGLMKRKEAVEKMKDGIYLDKTRQENVEQIQEAMSNIAVALDQGADAVEVVYSELLRDALSEVKRFNSYVKDPENYNKPEYINYVLNFSKFIETYRGLYTVQESGVLNETQSKLILKLMGELNKLQTITAPDGTRTEGVIDKAIDNYVRSFVTDNSNRDFTEEDLNDLMTMAKDMGSYELQSYDMSSSSDTLLALMDKLFKRKKQEVLDRVDLRNNSIRQVMTRLLKLSSGKKIDYSFMLQYDPDGSFNGRYIQEIGYDYFRERADLRNDLFDKKTGEWMEYVFIEDLENAKPEDIEKNKNLAKAKAKYGKYLSTERHTEEGPIDGEFHRYTEQFKEERAKYQVYNSIGRGFWERKKGVSDVAYQRFIAKNYDVRTVHYKINDSNGDFTGMTRIDSRPIVKKKHSEIRPISASGKDMRDPKWVKLMNPTDSLGEAQKDFYLMFRHQFEEELLRMLPMETRDQMLGYAPLIKDKFYDDLKTKPNIMTRMWAKTTRSATDFFTETGSSKKVMTDENGNFIDTLPIYYVGNPRSETALKEIENEISALKKKFNSGKLSKLKYDDQKRELEIKRAQILSQPAKDEISQDLGDSLLRFSGMAENYEVMSSIEDTLTAMLKVVEKRQYSPSDGQKLFSKVKGKMKQVGIPGVSTEGEKNMVRRAKKWMKMVYYDNDKMTRTWYHKSIDNIIRYSSLSYVAFNVFGNINNYTIARINNGIELAGGRFFDKKAYIRASAEFNKRMLPDLARKTAFIGTKNAHELYVPKSKYEVLVDHFRMMDDKADIRETQDLNEKESWLAKKLNWGYLLNDAFEYNVQTKVGMAVLMSKTIMNSKTGVTLNLYDAYTLNGDGTATLKEGFDTLVELDSDGKIIKEKEFTNDVRYDIRNEIREVNKQIHGNYAYEDRMVMQSHALGQLVAQFHKWVVPAIKARFRPEYFDENVGWLEGRYKSMWSFMKYSATHLGEINKWSTNFQKQYSETDEEGNLVNGVSEQAKMKMLNVWRSMGELGLIMSTLIVGMLLENLFDDDDDDGYIQKRLENALMYQADRTYKEMVQFMPFTPTGLKQIYQMGKSPIASTRTLGELAEAVSATLDYGYGKLFLSDKDFKTNSKYVYQNKPRKGQLKLSKQWADAVPLWYSIQRWRGYDKEHNFNIK